MDSWLCVILCAYNAGRCSNAFDSMDSSSDQGKAQSLNIVKWDTQPAIFDFTVRIDQVDADVNWTENRH